MRTLLQLVVGCCILLSLSTQPVTGQQDNGEAAYRRWCETLDANPWLGVPQWFRTDQGPLEHRQAVRDLLSFGPNLLPVLVQELRQETDQLKLLIFLLKRASGINLYSNSGRENYWDAVRDFRTDFLTKWDAGAYQEAATRLSREWHGHTTPGSHAGPVDAKALTPLIRYGIFAVPFIAEQLSRENCNALFAAYLLNTGQLDLYRTFLRNPEKLCPAPKEKVAHIRRWVRDNRARVSQLPRLSKEFDALALK